MPDVQQVKERISSKFDDNQIKNTTFRDDAKNFEGKSFASHIEFTYRHPTIIDCPQLWCTGLVLVYHNYRIVMVSLMC